MFKQLLCKGSIKIEQLSQWLCCHYDADTCFLYYTKLPAPTHLCSDTQMQCVSPLVVSQYSSSLKHQPVTCDNSALTCILLDLKGSSI